MSKPVKAVTGTGKGTPTPQEAASENTQAQAAETQSSQEQQPEKSKEELLQEIERLKSQIKSPQNFDDLIEYYQRKQRLINRLESLQTTSENLTEHIKVVESEAAEDIFTSENFRITLSYKKQYGSENELFKVRNPAIITEVLYFILSKVDNKINDLQNEIGQ